ncbi:hypothetical protein TELCIR_25197, partial [Teladorsagia circumcincta]
RELPSFDAASANRGSDRADDTAMERSTRAALVFIFDTDLINRRKRLVSEARVSMEEFAPIYKNVKKEAGAPPSAEELHNLLAHFDREGTGIVMLPDLRYMLQNS